MYKIFVEGKVVSEIEFESCWATPDLHAPSTEVAKPFVQLLSEKGYVPLEKALHLLARKARIGFLSLELYDVDRELARRFPKDPLYRWCVLPFDRMSRSILVSTANPYNKQAALELEAHTKERLVWCLSPPAQIRNLLTRSFQ